VVCRTARPERGATFIEYSLLVGLFAVTATLGISVIEARSETKIASVESHVGELPPVQGSIPVGP
jgi:Flp pilus assembly pilin Flp